MFSVTLSYVLYTTPVYSSIKYACRSTGAPQVRGSGESNHSHVVSHSASPLHPRIHQPAGLIPERNFRKEFRKEMGKSSIGVFRSVKLLDGDRRGSGKLPWAAGAGATAAGSGAFAPTALAEGIAGVALALGADPKLMGSDAKGAVGNVTPLGSGEGLTIGVGSGVAPVARWPAQVCTKQSSCKCTSGTCDSECCHSNKQQQRGSA